MNVTPINTYKHTALPLKQNRKQPQKNINFTNAQTTPLTKDDFKRADEYCKIRCNELKECALGYSGAKFSLTNNFDLEKLNGIQYGIDLFAGMTMKEVAFVLQKPAVLLNRGCPNLCSHCFLNALPPQQLEGAKSFTYEDFEKLYQGISEIKKRIEKYGINLIPHDFSYLFQDSDCINVDIKDKNNNLYDMVDCFEILRKNGFTTSGQYDTSGWTPTSTRHQKRAEKFVKYVQDTYKDKNIKSKPVKEVMVSINPFHSIYQKYIDLRDSDFEKANKYRDLYINRMANTLYTFSPLLDVEGLIYFPNITALNSNPKYSCNVMNSLINRILSRLDEMYDEKGTSSELKRHYMFKYIGLISLILINTSFRFRQLDIAGRAKSIAPDSYDEHKIFLFENSLLRRMTMDTLIPCIEPNGRVDIDYKDRQFGTDIQLNLSQKDKLCHPLGGQDLNQVLRPNNSSTRIDDNISFIS